MSNRFTFLAALFPTGLIESSTSLNVRIKISVGDGEPIESAVRRFTREVKKSGHLMELRHKRYFENSQEKKKRKVKEGRLRKKFERMANRRMRQNQQPPGTAPATTVSGPAGKAAAPIDA